MGGSLRFRGGEGDEEVSEGADYELVGVLTIQSKIAEEQLVELLPVGPNGVQPLGHHHLLHRPPEIRVRVRRVSGDCQPGAHSSGGLLHDGVG